MIWVSFSVYNRMRWRWHDCDGPFTLEAYVTWFKGQVEHSKRLGHTLTLAEQGTFIVAHLRPSGSGKPEYPQCQQILSKMANHPGDWEAAVESAIEIENLKSDSLLQESKLFKNMSVKGKILETALRLEGTEEAASLDQLRSSERASYRQKAQDGDGSNFRHRDRAYNRFNQDGSRRYREKGRRYSDSKKGYLRRDRKPNSRNNNRGQRSDKHVRFNENDNAAAAEAESDCSEDTLDDRSHSDESADEFEEFDVARFAVDEVDHEDSCYDRAFCIVEDPSEISRSAMFGPEHRGDNSGDRPVAGGISWSISDSISEEISNIMEEEIAAVIADPASYMETESEWSSADEDDDDVIHISAVARKNIIAHFEARGKEPLMGPEYSSDEAGDGPGIDYVTGIVEHIDLDELREQTEWINTRVQELKVLLSLDDYEPYNNGVWRSLQEHSGLPEEQLMQYMDELTRMTLAKQSVSSMYDIVRCN